jgi:hypothetical protein
MCTGQDDMFDKDKISNPDGSRTPPLVLSVHSHTADVALLTHENVCLLFLDLTHYKKL